MADTGNILAPFPPPRFSGDLEQDYPAIVEYLRQLHLTVQAQNQVVQQVSDFDADAFNINELPDPSQATVGSAQETANEAYALAATNKGRLDDSGIGDWFIGSVTLSGTNTSVDYTFPEAQEDTDYEIFAQPVDYSGTPALEASLPIRITKLTNKFTITVNTAPGSGNSFTFKFLLIRGLT